MNQISQQRFDALAGYCRQPFITLYVEELAWFEHDNERLLGALIRDRVDSDFSGIILGRDARGRYRFVNGTVNNETQFEGLKQLEQLFEKESKLPPSAHFQGDEVGKKLDLFKQIAKDPAKEFLSLADKQWLAPARRIIEAMIYYFDDPDNNFVKDFQSTGFDARIWELYLFAAFHEQGFAFDRSEAAPDYNLTGLAGNFFVEAVTVRPTIDQSGQNVETGIPLDEQRKRDYFDNYIAIKYGSALFTKLQKQYWKKPHVSGKPLAIAVQDCHYPNSVVWSERHLSKYLYGKTFSRFLDNNGVEQKRAIPITEHRWLNKVIPSNFFSQPDAENISAVITSTQGTIDMFNRMAIIAGFGHGIKNVIRYGTQLVRRGKEYGFNHFAVDVCDPTYQEFWSSGMNVYHNPNALHKLAPQALPLAHHYLLNGNSVTNIVPNVHILNSMTNYGVPLKEFREKLQKITERNQK